MTGYGSGRAVTGDGHIVLDVRCVNHRYLDVRVRLPSKIQHLAPEVERRLRAKLERGRVDATVRLEGRPLSRASLDATRAKEALAELASLSKSINHDEPVPLSLLGIVPDLFVQDDTGDEDAFLGALREASDLACQEIDSMRTREGTALSKELASRLATVEQLENRLRADLPTLQQAFVERLRDRIATLLENTGVALDEGRLEQEIALLAERSDVAEELSRLESHRQQLLDLVQGSTGAVGKRIDFLLQELAREANTLGAKTSDAAAITTIIELKTEIERMREQAQNVL